MGYRIVYRPAQKKQHAIIQYIRLPILVVISFFLFILLVESMWPDGAALLKKAVVPSGGVVAVSALNHFANELQIGESFLTALAAFCGNLIS